MMMFTDEVNKGDEQAAAAVNPAAKYAEVNTELVTDLENKLANMDIKGIFKTAGEEFLSTINLENFMGRYRYLDEEATKIRNSLGLGVEKSEQLSLMVADNIARFAELGYKAQDVGVAFSEAVGAYGANIAITNEDLLELKATSEVTNTKIDSLANSFRGVGVGIGQVGDRMLDVVTIARNAGVSVKAVSDGVVKNLDKMNIYNFENGVKGLAKMSAQATRLGISMDSVFKIVDKVFNPEGAIELAGAMQRLGVQTGALLDPLRLMDLSQNDPTELQNQIVNMSKDFVRFNKELGQFEIMPGEKRRLKEIGEALGMNSGELQKMALNAANLDFKMKQIKFPSSIATKEDRELIATLASVNEAGIAEVRVKEIDKKTGEWTGRDEMVAVSELTVDQIKELKEGQELQGKSMEEIAKEQLSEATRLNALMTSLIQAVRFGSASSEVGRSLYELRTKTTREYFFQEKGREGGVISEGARKSGTYRGATDDISGLLTDAVTSAYDTIKNSTSWEEMSTVFSNIGDSADKLLNNLKNFNFSELFGVDLSFDGIAESFGIGGSTTDKGTNFANQVNSTTNTSTNTSVNTLNTVNKSQFIEVKPIDINEKVDVNITVTLDPALKDQALTVLATKAITEYFTGGQSTKNGKNLLHTLDMLKSTQNLVVSNTTQKTYTDQG